MKQPSVLGGSESLGRTSLEEHGDPGRRRMSRRVALCVGGLGALGLSLGDFLRLRAAHGEAPSETYAIQKGQGKLPERIKSVIQLNLGGGFPQHESFAPTPEAPLEYRGSYGVVKTRNGDHFSDDLPKSVAIPDKLTVIRTVVGKTASGTSIFEAARFCRSPNTRSWCAASPGVRTAPSSRRAAKTARSSGGTRTTAGRLLRCATRTAAACSTAASARAASWPRAVATDSCDSARPKRGEPHRFSILDDTPADARPAAGIKLLPTRVAVSADGRFVLASDTAGRLHSWPTTAKPESRDASPAE